MKEHFNLISILAFEFLISSSANISDKIDDRTPKESQVASVISFPLKRVPVDEHEIF